MRVAVILALVLSASICYASGDPNKVLEDVRDRNDGKDYVSNVVLRIMDADGGIRERHLHMLQKDMHDEEMVMLLFYNPSDVRGVGFMIDTYPESSGKPDNQWIYLPAFGKIRRISSRDKRGSFMGSDFAYTDLDKLRVSEFKSTMIGESVIDERPVWVIDRVPASQEVINKTGYYRIRVYVDKERSIILKYEYFDIKGIKFKEQKSTQVKLIDNIWTITQAEMKNHITGCKSEMYFNDMAYNVGLGDPLFSRSVLKRGIKSADVPQLSRNKDLEH